jgi:hypothetical protein
VKLIMRSLSIAQFAQLVFVSLSGAARAATFDPAQMSGTMCLTSDQAATALNAGEISGQSRQSMLASNVRVQLARTLTAESCAHSPQQQSFIANNGSIPAPFIASLGAVQSFITKAQPGSALNVGVSGTDVHLYYYGSTYVIVAFSRNSTNTNVLGCSNESSYRVSRATGEVLQFDGCVESHRRVLPTFSQLPPA